FCHLTLDPNTAHRYLILSEKNRAVRDSERKQQYSDHPDRFDTLCQVLSKESVCGCCYWEVEWSGGVSISVSYKDISRKGRGDEYFCYLTLDPNTTHRHLILSEKNRAVRYSVRKQKYSVNSDRFHYWPQVLSKESVCGRCYWEVEWSGGPVYISVSYKDISRKGQDFCDLSLDPNTAHRKLILSQKNRAVTCSEREQKYSDHPERFDSYTQVLCKESVCGRCYWEVEWSSERWVSISVSYKGISRKGR
ncbi:tripartite motif-containing protein 16-like isoform X1, partial [Clarias magur]